MPVAAIGGTVRWFTHLEEGGAPVMSPTDQASGPRIRYMGSKHGLAQRVVALCASEPIDRPLVDLFGGMCSVAGSVAPSGRSAWANDVQSFAALAGRCLIASRHPPLDRDRAVRLLAAPYRDNLRALSERFGPALEVERRILTRDRHAAFLKAQRSWPHVANDALIAAETEGLQADPAAFPYRLATLTFAWGYFGLRQSVELDSIRYAIDQAESALRPDEVDWCKLAVLQTASRISSSPGHFAQYLSGVRPEGFRRVVAARKRRAWDGFLDGLETMTAYGSASWRRRNRVFNHDALEIWPSLDRALRGRRAIYYADPPYSKEHYSRYYHVLETLTRYDYPPAVGQGRYRPDRFRTPFSIKTEVVNALHRLCDSIANRNGTLILSYPSTGLITKELSLPMNAILKQHFTKVALKLSVSASHSTLGARHGAATEPVTEFVWMAE